MIGALQLRQFVKARENPLADFLYRAAKGARSFSVPVARPLHGALYRLHLGLRGSIAAAARVFWTTPLFQSRLEETAPRLYLYSGMPLVLGPLRIRIGGDCRVSGLSTFSGRSAPGASPVLTIGKNCDIGWQTSIAVGGRVQIGDNVRIAGRAFLAGYPGHPLDAAARAAGKPDTDDQIGDIVLEDDVWLATGVTVSAGVRIGRGTIVAAESVVTKDLPPNVLAGGIPAKVIRALDSRPA